MRLPPSPLSSGQSSPILPVHFPTPTRIRNYKNIAVISVFATLAILLVVQGGRSEVAGDYLERIRGAVEARVGEECPIEEDFGGDEGEVGRPTKLVVRVRPEGRHSTTTRPANQLSNVQFHPTLSSQFPKFFPTANIAPSPSSLVEQSIEGEEKCGEEGRIIHTLPILPPPFLRPGESNLFFSICTSPERVIEFAQPIWSHFLSTPLTPSQAPSSIMRKLWSDKPSSPPGCLIVDARGQENSLMERANEVLGEAGTGCVMRDSSRVGERYEMRVLGLVNDAWEESERRRKNHSVDGGIVEWFVFGDDDTWWTDQASIRELVAGFDWREDHILGGFSEAEGNYQDHGRIAYGGAGILISRNLVRKMQPLVNECAQRYGHLYGGDGLISNCAAFAKGVEIRSVVDEIPGMSQFDLRGDASGYLSSGNMLLSLHHWVGWLELIPGRMGIEVIGLLRKGASVVGGRNLLRRWVFDDGRVTWSVGYSIIIHRERLDEDGLIRMEHTWPGFQPRRPSRSARQEGLEKFTYYIKEVERLSERITRFRHVCEDVGVEPRIIDVLWDEGREESGGVGMRAKLLRLWQGRR